jgi:hypothetical protein
MPKIIKINLDDFADDYIHSKMNLPEIAEKYGIHIQTLNKYRKKLGLKRNLTSLTTISYTKFSKYIIENYSDCSNVDIFECIANIISKGKISGAGDKNQYCYCTVFPNAGISIFCSLLKTKTIKFTIHNHSV